MTAEVRWLRISYWVGAIVDLLAAVGLLVPPIGSIVYGISSFDPGSDYQYAAGVAASLMLGWTVLLLWADRRPLERRGVLMLTVCPVLVGLIASGVLAVRAGFVSIVAMVPTWVLQLALCALFLFSYLRSRHAATR
jgi:hypothetical protein